MQKQQVIDTIIEHEGKLNENEPESVGGVSNFGISQKAFNDFGFQGSVRDLTREDPRVHKFYDMYLGKYHVWEVPEFLQYIFADFAVNAGGTALKIIQEMAGVAADGVWGSGTSRAVAEWKEKVFELLETDPDIDNDLIMRFHDAKLAHYERLAVAKPEVYGQWLGGWKRRANEVLSELKPYFETSEKPPALINAEERQAIIAEVSLVAETSTESDADGGQQLSAYSDADILAEYTRRFGDPLEGTPEASTACEPDRLPEGTISGDALSEALLHQVIVPHDCREKVWSIDEGTWIEGLSPARFTDSRYKLPTREEVDAAIRLTKVDEMGYVAEAWDCDDFARRFVSKMHDQGIKTAGRVKAWSGNHAFNIVAVQADTSAGVEFIFVEPQTDEIVEPSSEDKYNISNALIIIS